MILCLAHERCVRLLLNMAGHECNLCVLTSDAHCCAKFALEHLCHSSQISHRADVVLRNLIAKLIKLLAFSHVIECIYHCPQIQLAVFYD